ncbi:MAG: DUF1223 domain-containing protein [Dokdonella sp.]
MRNALVVLGVLAIAPVDVPAACSAQSSADRPHLVELYTAEGCASCPPAEHWMSSLRASKQYIGLEFHVDYFDVQGWRDPFADARYTERQKALTKHGAQDAHFSKSSLIYTPQVFVDGRLWKNWPKAAPPAVGTAQAPALNLDVTLGSSIHAKAASPTGAALQPSYRLYVALTENGLSSAVKAGENRGKRLDHDLVVRDLAGPLDLPQAEAELKLPDGFDAAKSAVVAFVQDEKSGDIVQALRLPLAQCTR